MIDEKKICIIACVNNNMYWQECLLYLAELVIPEGYTIDVLVVEEAKSMCAGYNEAMKASDAKYKIYMHQDVFLTDRFLLCELLDIFHLDKTIGMVGLVGNPKLGENAIPWESDRIVSIGMNDEWNCDDCFLYVNPMRNQIVDVEAIDGLFMATSVDIPWREDLFDGWDFYDVSHTQEMRKRGYRVVVPSLGKILAVHDDGLVMNLLNYEKYRMRFIEEYL